jgi:phage repressor protein C with HTH and peptisase S24 domain
MLTHRDVWNGIEQLAARNGLSASGLARRAGLDPTTFNKSKRMTGAGRARWPSTESIAKILEATNTSMAEFVTLMYGPHAARATAGPRLRSIAWSSLGGEGVLDAAGFAQGQRWEEIELPLTDDPQAYAVELDTDVAAPVFRAGDVVVVSPSSSIRRNDRVLLRQRSGALELGILVRRTAQRVTLGDVLGQAGDRVLTPGEIAWMARIVWLSQ